MSHRSNSRPAIVTCAVAVAMGLAMGVAAPASAQPRRTPVESGLPFTYEAGQVCRFPVLIEEAEPSGLDDVDFGNGRSVTAGRLVVELTNEETGRSIVRDISGQVTVKGDRQKYFGASVSGVLPGEDPQGLWPAGRGLFFIRGIFEVEGDVFTRVTGVVEDICQTLSTTGA